MSFKSLKAISKQSMNYSAAFMVNKQKCLTIIFSLRIVAEDLNC